MFTLSGRPRLPDVRRRGQGRAADAAARRAPRADRRVRRRGHRQADPGARARRAHRRPGRHQRRQRDRAGPVRRLADGRRRRPRARRPLGQRQPSRSSTIRRSSTSITKQARTLHTAADMVDRDGRGLHRRPARRTAGRSSSTSRWTSSSTPRPARPPAGTAAPRLEPDGDDLGRGRRLLAAAARPVLILGTDVWADGAEEAALRFVEALGIPTITNGMGRGIVPGGHPLLVTKARARPSAAPTSWSSSARPLDFRLGYGVFGGKDGADARPRSCTSPTPPARSPRTPTLAASVAGDLTTVLDGLARAGPARRRGRLVHLGRPSSATSSGRRRARRRAAHGRGRPDPPGPHLRRAGAAAGRRRGGHRRRRRLRQLRRQVRRAAAARRLARPRPLRLPRRRPGRGHRRPAGPAVGAGRAAARRRRGRLLADGRRHPGPPRPAGRHGDGQQLRLGAGEGPDADALRLRRGRRPGPAHGRTTRWSRRSAAPARRSPTRRQIGPALDRAFASGVPYLVNVITDVEAAYPRSTFGI